jgi:hypothetical protein
MELAPPAFILFLRVFMSAPTLQQNPRKLFHIYIYIFILFMCFVSGFVCRKIPTVFPNCPVQSTYLQGKTWFLPGSLRTCGFTSSA